MADITKCNDEGCERRKQCFRFMSVSNENWQSYFAESPRKDEGCDHFYQVEEGMRFREKV